MKQGVTRRDILRAFWEQMKPYTKWLIVFVLFLVAANAVETVEPWVMKWLVDAFLGDRVWTLIIPPLTAFASFRVGHWILWRIADAIAPRFQPHMISAARERVFARVVKQDLSYFNDTPAGSLVYSVGKFVDGLNELGNVLFYNILPVVIAVASTFISVAFRSWWLAAGFAVWVILLFFVQQALAKRQQVQRRDVAEADSLASALLADAIGNATTVKAFATEEKETRALAKRLDVVAGKERHAWLKDNWYWGTQWICFMVLEVGFMGGVAWGWQRGMFTAGDFVLVQTYTVILYRVLGEFSRVFRQVPRIFAQAEPITVLMQGMPDVLDAPDAKSLRVTHGAIQFDRVGFSYKTGRSILKDFSLSIKPGEKIAFVGPSGAGKSTIVKMLYRFYDTKKGSILIDDQNIASVTQESLRRQLSLVPQDPALFHRSILDNIRYARPSASEADVVRAAKRAHCHEFVSRLSDGYKTLVGERGVKLSGGERQRVAIARAILADTPILVLDEATSSLDSESESLIQAALHELMMDKTVIVIAHRLSTIMEMDRIVVVEKGRVAAQGTHAQLLKTAGTYQRLWNLQSGGYMRE